MDIKLEKYLNTVDKHLKPLPASERADIVREIKSSMIEMEQEELSSDAILERLGDPKELARAYLGDLVTNSRGFVRYYRAAGSGHHCAGIYSVRSGHAHSGTD